MAGQVPLAAKNLAVPEDFGKRLPVDYRVVDEIILSTGMMQDQGVDFLWRWGGPSLYKEVSRLDESTRVLFYAREEGYIDDMEISIMTGLSLEAIEVGDKKLKDKGLDKVKK
ncbi:hypothetical protein LCGC14_1107000 [marine sediment metagenome]|uniref:Uncharacterized protein n=1 Tax=marine sediment metagenome TaxID=412755 RepID=A0A0F9QE20_9ZZZZ